jgi:hypothetical protein
MSLTVLCISSKDGPAAAWNSAIQVLNTRWWASLMKVWDRQRRNTASHNAFSTFFDFATALNISEVMARDSDGSSASTSNFNVDCIRQGYISASRMNETAGIKSALWFKEIHTDVAAMDEELVESWE